MRNRDRSNLRLSRQSVQLYPTDISESQTNFTPVVNYHESSYTRMLIEDVHNGIMPYIGMTKKYLKAHIETENPEAEFLIEEAINRKSHTRRLYDSVAEFVRNSALRMISNGKAVYEIAYYYDSDESPQGFALVDVLSNSVKVRGKRIYQHIPNRISQRLNLQSRVIELTTENFLICEFPKEIRAAYMPMMEALYAQGQLTSMPDFVLPSLKGEISRIPFDLSKFSRDQKLAVANATKSIGWDTRQVPDDVLMTEYYYLTRYLRFEKFKLELREVVLSTLNEAIMRAGKKLKFTGRIIVEGLPTRGNIKEAQQKLSEGNGKFGEIIQPFQYY